MAQVLEGLGQVPVLQGGRLIKRVWLQLDQRQVMQRVEDHVFAFIASWMARDHLAAREAGEPQVLD